ncbi:MAG: hypothetical protein U1F76_00425 [Candidatus Competibacteraceae bacterium]
MFANLGRAQTRLETISGFSRYRQEVRSLPPSEQTRIDRTARLVVASHRPGQYPIVTVRVVGHADFDTPRRPAFERKISGKRAQSVQRALMSAIDRYATRQLGKPLSRRIRWEDFAMGASRPLHPAPRTETERARNRRVDILLVAAPFHGRPRTFYEKPRAFRLTGAPSQPTCTHPAPPQKAIVRSGGIVFEAEVTTRAFNPLPRGCIQQFVFANDPNAKALRFSCHRVEARSDCRAFVIPAWAYEGAVGATLPAGQKDDDWEYGFIQTVQSSRVLHVYGTVGRECVIASPTRDALSGTPSPWMWSATVKTLGSPVPTYTEDSPHTIARIDHPTIPNQKLRQVCFEGTFLIWLAARNKISSAAPVLLVFKQIVVGRTWELIPERDPLDPQAWVAYGGQRESSRGDGNTANRPLPKLDGPTAGSLVATCFKPVTDKSCRTKEQPEFMNNCLVGGDCMKV